MGIYPDHGVEYHVLLKNGRKHSVASTKDTDDRLIKSKYLEKRHDEWMSLCHSRCIPLKDVDDLDVELTIAEKQ